MSATAPPTGNGSTRLRLHTFVALVEDKPGVLARVASLFRRRAYNIDSLTVGRTGIPSVSRMTIVMAGDDATARLVEANLYKLVNVLRVADVTDQPVVIRDLALLKIAADAGVRAQVLQLCEVFRARVIDVSPEALIVEITGTEDKLSGLVEVLRPFGILEMVRTGSVAMTRGGDAILHHAEDERDPGDGSGPDDGTEPDDGPEPDDGTEPDPEPDDLATRRLTNRAR